MYVVSLSKLWKLIRRPTRNGTQKFFNKTHKAWESQDDFKTNLQWISICFNYKSLYFKLSIINKLYFVNKKCNQTSEYFHVLMKKYNIIK